MRRTLAAAALTIAVVGLSAGTAFAADDDYTPNTPDTLTLAGSTASSDCKSDVPWINFSVTLTDPKNIAKGHTAYLELSDGTNSTDIKLGDLKGNKISGSVLWPGASVDSKGNATGWPGWAEVNGKWVETTGNFAWTRGNITAKLHVNPEVVVPLSYPKASAACANPTAVSAEAPSSLALTGGTISLAAAGVGVAALAVGAGLTLRRRRAQR